MLRVSARKRCVHMTEVSLLKVQNLRVSYPIHSSILQRRIGENMAVKDVNFTISAGQTVGLVGESGSGKSTVARTIIGLEKADGGRIEFEGRDITQSTRTELKALRRDMQMVFQDPFASLNPRLSVQEIIVEPWLAHPDVVPKNRRASEAKALMDRVGLNPDYASRFPHQFSGGQRQRIGIARALALQPKLIICDEAVSALDVSVQAQVLNLLDDLKQEFNLAYLFISHDLSVIEHICDRVLVLNGGVVVEEGTPRELFENPQDDYTKRLFAAVPVIRPWLNGASSKPAGTIPRY
ncbi:peptide ABC transporter ATP-binding protein [Arthrobacter psychrolactophilus]|uniref:Peptide ABC transporter ATP-binding protein n=2 Tax=Arthrobacter psychrolactophilus TaxID=92442 RepID=A0A2V5J469_9MICC|nr:peptide ABC transporter ATP-binding protein [Arthrobacter psychrolactophilus]